MNKTAGMIGLGIMGMPMSANMLKDGILVYGYGGPRSNAEKIAILEKMGGKGRSISPGSGGKDRYRFDLSAQRGFFKRCDFRERRDYVSGPKRHHRRGNEHLPDRRQAESPRDFAGSRNCHARLSPERNRRPGGPEKTSPSLPAATRKPTKNASRFLKDFHG